MADQPDEYLQGHFYEWWVVEHDGPPSTPEEREEFAAAFTEWKKTVSESTAWKGQVVLDLDIYAVDDDDAMERMTSWIAPLLTITSLRRCSIAERRVVLRQFFGHPDAPWQKQVMAQNASHLIDIALQVAEFVGPVTPGDALEPDLHIHRQVLEESIDRALNNKYRQGVDAGKLSYGPTLDSAIKSAESPERIATLLREFASRYDERGWSDEANLLRDAASQVEDMPRDLPKGADHE